METIIVTILTGLFSLSGIWYQNYLNRKSNSIPQMTSTVKQVDLPGYKEGSGKSNQKKRVGLRIFFTLLIVILPWVIFQVLLPYLTYSRFGDETGRQRTMFLYYSIWFIITIIALISGWKRKTIFEKIILIGSGILLLVMLYPLNLKE